LKISGDPFGDEFKKMPFFLNLDKVEKLEGLHNLVNLEELNVGLHYPLLKSLLKRLGGVDLEGFVNEPQNIVRYCRAHL
jgi:hypothetical protein